MRDEHDRDLVVRIVAGEVAAFADLYRCYAGAVRAVARSYIRDPDAVADLVQDVFAHALERLHTLRRPGRFRAWLLAIARHAAIDYRRTGAPGRFVTIEDIAAAAEPGPGPAEAVLRDETARLFRECVDRLSERDATALALVVHLGFGPVEVGAALGVTTGAAKVILHRARRRLRTAVLVEFFLRRRLPGCQVLEAIRADPAAAARHVRRCGGCFALASHELALADQARHARPTPLP